MVLVKTQETKRTTIASADVISLYKPRLLLRSTWLSYTCFPLLRPRCQMRWDAIQSNIPVKDHVGIHFSPNQPKPTLMRQDWTLMEKCVLTVVKVIYLLLPNVRCKCAFKPSLERKAAVNLRWVGSKKQSKVNLDDTETQSPVKVWRARKRW